MKTIYFTLGLLLTFSPAFAGTLTLNGAGATFPYPLYAKWFSEYKKVDAGVEINYQSIGSGGGIRQLLDKTIDFGASDAPMTDEQLSKSAVPILHIPTVLGAVVVTYNLPGITKPLRFSGQILADVFIGKITKWNDPELVKLNPGVALPDTAVLVAHRSDGSGTSAVFTDYLSKVCADWKSKVGSGTSVNWPAGLGGKGNEGVTGIVKQTPGAIGYVELTYASSNNLPVAEMQNKAGKFVAPTTKSVSAAAAGALKTMPKDFRVSITDSPSKDAYPIASFTYLLVYQKMNKAKGDTLKHFVHWALSSGQAMAAPLSYAPLPTALVKSVEKRMNEVTAE
jgi:phosphate transport system substrate-binding protein